MLGMPQVLADCKQLDVTLVPGPPSDVLRLEGDTIVLVVRSNLPASGHPYGIWTDLQKALWDVRLFSA